MKFAHPDLGEKPPGPVPGEYADGEGEAGVGALRSDPPAVAEGPDPGRPGQHEGGGGAVGSGRVRFHLVAPRRGVGEAELLDAGRKRVLPCRYVEETEKCQLM